MKPSSSVLIAACLLAAACDKPAPAPATTAADRDANSPAPSAGPVKGIDRSHKGQPFPSISFLDGRDRELSLRPLLGRPVLVNLWATWCAPCVKELPTLAALAKQAPGGLQVVAISQDMAPRASLLAFLAHHRIDLALYRDPKMALSAALGPETVLPTSILYDSEGKEVWRFVGELDWTGPEAARLVGEGGGATTG